MIILFVGMPFSIHTARWISLVNDLGWDVHFFSSFQYAKAIPELENIVFHDYPYNIQESANPKLKYKTFTNTNFLLPDNKHLKKWMGRIYRLLGLQNEYSESFEKLVQKLNPDIIHSHETQHAGYLVSEYYSKLKDKKKPIWIHSTYGIDIDYFQHFSNHKERIKTLFNQINIFLYEGKRDLYYAENLGFKGRAYNFPSAGGGYKTDLFEKYNLMPPSKRKIILVKGYQDNVRRGLCAIRAVVRCADILQDYDVYVYSCAKVVSEYIEYVNSKYKLNIKIHTETNYENWVRTLCSARVTITTNLSDGLPIFDSMLAGAFHIQSDTSMADEWIVNGVNGFIVPAEDPEIIEIALRKALEDDKLVDSAATKNFKKVKESLDFEIVKKKAIKIYNDAIIQ